MVDCRNPECITRILKLDEMDYTKTRAIVKNGVYTAIDARVLPKSLISIINAKNYNALVKACELNPCLFNQAYNFDLKLRQASDMAGKNRLGCCFKLEWQPVSGSRYLSFNQMLNLNRYRVRFYRDSHLHWFLNSVLFAYKTYIKAKHFISNNKYFPANNLVKNKTFNYVDRFDKKQTNGVIKSGCCNLKKLDYVNWLKHRHIIDCNRNC